MVIRTPSFLKIIDNILSGYGRLEIDLNTLFVNFIMEKKFNFSKRFLETAITPEASVLAKKTKKIWNKSHF